MEFTNHFAKNHAIVFLQIGTNGSCISEKWNLSSFEFIFVLTHHSSSKNELRTVYLSFHVIWLLIVLNCEKTMAWFLAKWFANSIFEFLVLHCIIHPIFRFISPLEVQKPETGQKSGLQTNRKILWMNWYVNTNSPELEFFR